VKLVADESVDGPVVERLRRDGHDVIYIAEAAPSLPDDEVLRQADTRKAILLTADKDFGEMVFRQGLAHSGVTLIRLAGLANATKAKVLGRVFREHAEDLVGAFSVVSPDQIRVRRR
jgi:predicted nuclease of predicted toxin-antitoxin system